MPDSFFIRTYDAQYTFDEQPGPGAVKITKENKNGERHELYISHQALLSYVAYQHVAPRRRQLNAYNGPDPLAYLVKENA